MTYVPPEVNDLTPNLTQRFIIRETLSLVRDLIVQEGLTGRGSGQSTLRGMLAQAIIDDDIGGDGKKREKYALYEVLPIRRADDE